MLRQRSCCELLPLPTKSTLQHGASQHVALVNVQRVGPITSLPRAGRILARVERVAVADQVGQLVVRVTLEVSRVQHKVVHCNWRSSVTAFG